MISRTGFIRAAAAAGVALAALGTASVAQARSDVFFSFGANIAPGVTLGLSNSRYYAPPVYVQPSPVYYEPSPVYYQPSPVYYQPSPVYYQPEPVYYQPEPVYYQPEPVYYQPAPVYYQPSVYVAPPVYPVTYVRPYHNRYRPYYRY